jgi:two-component system, NtrC family, sensor histidine kinase GlrK
LARTATGKASGFSLRALVGGGFTIVGIFLGIAVIFAIGSLQSLVERSEELLNSGVATTRLIEQLAERITEVERAARQYTVVGSPDLLQIYRDREQALLRTLTTIEARDDVSALMPILQELRVLLEGVRLATEIPPAARQHTVSFSEMNDVAQRVRQVAQGTFETDLARLQTGVARVRTALIALTAAIVAAALLAALAFARLVNRPIREITSSIDHLGRAELESPIQVSGPRDLQAIGNSLEWLRKRIVELETEKSSFVRHMSHELKSPLSNIRAGVDLLKDNDPNAADKQEIISIVDRNVIRLQRQIDDLLRYAGWQDAQPPQLPVPVRLDVLIEKSVADQAPEARSRDISVCTKLTPLTLVGGESQIRSIMDNLIGNAIKYSPDHGVVEVRLTRQGEAAVIEVEDQGPGIPGDLRERVFEPFFRGPAAATKRGTGIGLSLAAAAARAHGGAIEVLDKQGGARLQAVLPLAGSG